MKLYAVRNNDFVSLLFDGKHHQFHGEKADEVFNQYKKCKVNPSQENFDILKEVIAPITKVLHSGIIEEDNRGNYFLKDTKIPMPEGLADQILATANEGLPVDALVRFWKLCMLNPNKQARDDFFKYCKHFGIVITDKGYAVLYKSVANKTKRDNNETFLEFVSKSIIKVKTQKKSPSKFDVYSAIGETKYRIINTDLKNLEFNTELEDGLWVLVGNLQDLHNSADDLKSDEDIYRPHHSGTHGMEIQLGIPVTMPREECDPDTSHSCSYGLHIGATSYVQTFAGNKAPLLACLVNPMNIVALPEYDHSKIRCCEYFPYAVLERNEDGTMNEISDESYWEEDYQNYEDVIFDSLKEGDFSHDPMMAENKHVVEIAQTIEI